MVHISPSPVFPSRPEFNKCSFSSKSYFPKQHPDLFIQFCMAERIIVRQTYRQTDKQTDWLTDWHATTPVAAVRIIRVRYHLKVQQDILSLLRPSTYQAFVNATCLFVESTAMALGFSLEPVISKLGLPPNPSVDIIPTAPLPGSVK